MTDELTIRVRPDQKEALAKMAAEMSLRLRGKRVSPASFLQRILDGELPPLKPPTYMMNIDDLRRAIEQAPKADAIPIVLTDEEWALVVASRKQKGGE